MIVCFVGGCMGAGDYKKVVKEILEKNPKSWTPEQVLAEIKKSKASMTPEQWENQRQAAIEIVGPHEVFDQDLEDASWLSSSPKLPPESDIK